VNPNDPLFSSQMTTWCPRCAKQYTASAGELSLHTEIDCDGCQYRYEVDTWNLQAEIQDEEGEAQLKATVDHELGALVCRTACQESKRNRGTRGSNHASHGEQRI
jgi:hypothetical protein